MALSESLGSVLVHRGFQTLTLFETKSFHFITPCLRILVTELKRISDHIFLLNSMRLRR